MKPTRSIEDYATVEAYDSGHPVYAFGYTYVYGVSPDFTTSDTLQQSNTAAITKFVPRKSWEILSNRCGSTPAREPKTAWNDDQPLLPVHLIDGDPDTIWCSRGMIRPDTQPAWIRIDLPRDEVIARVILRCVPKNTYKDVNLGRALPDRLEIRLSTNGHDWTTAFQRDSAISPEADQEEILLTPTSAKVIWILADGLPRVGEIGRAFSLAGVELHNPEGLNLALVSRGAGIQVSSTYFGFGMDRFTQDMLWPLQYDLGFKWTRVGYDIGLFLWSYVEREKGVLQIDPRADAAITEAHANGLQVILCLDKGNCLYQDPPRKTDWRRARVYEMMDTYSDHPGWPSDSDAQMDGYLRYVEYMVRHFKGRVAFYEIGNEWVETIGVDSYTEIVRRTVPVIKATDPNAAIMLGSVEVTVQGIDADAILACLEQCGPELVQKLDAVGFHPWYHPDVTGEPYRNYRSSFTAFKTACEKLGFQGEYIASEWAFFAAYPRPEGEEIVPQLLHKHWGTELQKAKYCAQLMTAHAGLGIISLFNETFQTARLERDVTLLRNSSFQCDPITPSQPQAAYYTLRSISTILDGFEPATWAMELDFPGEIECYTFANLSGERLAALWLPGEARDPGIEHPCSVRVPGMAGQTAKLIDSLNGTEQNAIAEQEETTLILRGVLVRDYPVFVRIGTAGIGS